MKNLLSGRSLALVVVVCCAAIGAGCDNDGDGGGGGNSALQNAADGACDNAVECAEEQAGIELDRDQVCTGYDRFDALTGGSCVNAATAYLNCIANAECGDFDSCDSLADASNDACSNDDVDAGNNDTSGPPQPSAAVVDAGEDACDKLIECVIADGGENPSRDATCAVITSMTQTSVVGGAGCDSATIAYFDCLADIECGVTTVADCTDEAVTQSTACQPTFP